jgi:hypothetical protein
MISKAGNKYPVSFPPILLNGVSFKSVSVFKYLGHIISDDLDSDEDIKKERVALANKAYILAHRLRQCTRPVKCSFLEHFAQHFIHVTYEPDQLFAKRAEYSPRPV